MTYEEDLDYALAHLRDFLLKKHIRYGEGHMLNYGELGVLVRASDKLARLGVLLTGELPDLDARAKKAWLKLAAHALQALVMFHTNDAENLLEEIDREELFNTEVSILEERGETENYKYPTRMRHTLL